MLCTLYVHAQDDFATSPLGMACRENQLEVVKVLIENGAMVNYRDKVCLHTLYILSYDYVLLLYLCILIRPGGRVFSMLPMRDMKKLSSICFTLMQTLKCRTR